MLEHVINGNEAGQRLDKFLVKYLPLAPKSFFYKMLRKKNITLNGRKAAGSEKLAEGDCIRFFLSEETMGKFSGQKKPAQRMPVRAPRSLPAPDILYEDRHTIFLNKPVGMLSQKASADDYSLVEYLTGYLLDSGQLTEGDLRTFHPAVCNRLDRNTSGIVAAGKTLPALQELSRLFRERGVKKDYLCLVDGTVQEKAHIDGYLTKDAKTNRVRFSKTESPGAARIETGYAPLAYGDGVTLLEVRLFTGKPHQIRAHMASAGFPIIGDPKYGDKRTNDRYRKAFGLTCQLLHAARLSVPEDAGCALEELAGKTILAPLPELFRKVCRAKNIGKEYLEWQHGIQEG